MLCTEQERIAQSIRTVMSQILSLHAAKVDARGDAKKLEAIDRELEKVQARGQSLLEQFRAHIQSHGCNAPKAVSATTGH
jgi:hypothetical protein